MTTKLLSAILFIAGFFTYAQDVKGYYVTASDNHVNGYFKQVNFFNEGNLYFKKSESDADYTKISAEEIKEYGAGTDVKFQKFTVNLDDSNLNGTDADTRKTGVYVQRTIFLNVIVEGDATLYSYSSDKGLKFFYKIVSKNIPPTQLLYKKYYINQSNIAESNMYRQQLFTDINCNEDKASAFSRKGYTKKDLVAVFETYNQCVGGHETVAYNANASKKMSFKMTFFAGAGITKTEVAGVSGTAPLPSATNETTLHAGGEFAVLLPSGKVSFFVRAWYENYSTAMDVKESTAYRSIADHYKIDADIFNFSVGPRYNFFLAHKHTLFADASFGVSLPSGNFYRYDETTTDLGTVGYEYDIKLKSDYFFNMGIGYEFNNMYGLELRYYTKRSFISSSHPEILEIGRVSLGLRYTIN